MLTKRGEIKIFLIGNCFTEFKIIDSTNGFIKRHIKNLPNGYLAFSTNQIAGYGTKNRIWTNFKNENLAISVLFKHINLQFLNLSTKLACVCVLSALNDLQIKNAKIKWFNDIIIANKKVAGALGEAQICGNKIHCILGIGINLLQTPNSFFLHNLLNAGSVLSTTQKTINPKLFLKLYVKHLNYFTLQLHHSPFNTTKQIQNIYSKNLQTCFLTNQKLKLNTTTDNFETI